MHPRPDSAARPSASAESVEELVRTTVAGQLRIPDFQRGLKWKREHVLDLFDSIYQGYPIGSLLFSSRPAKAELVRLGPLRIDAPEKSEAWWVVDGQQRLTSLAVALSFSGSVSSDSPYRVFFDPRDGTFHGEPDAKSLQLRVPLHQLLDSAELSEWMHTWQFGGDADLRRAVFEAGKRIREYKVPMYLVRSNETQVLRKIFYRTNNSGMRLNWSEVHDALFGSGADAPSTVDQLSTELQKLGMGSLKSSRLMSCLVAFRGGDTTQTLPEHYRRDPELLRHAVRDGLPVLRRVFSFLKHDADIPHVRLLPRSHPLEILSRFFGLHPDPNPRSKMLLARWLWRICFHPPQVAEATFRRRGIGLVDEDEELSVQRILELSDRQTQDEIALPSSFDARESGSRLVLATLAWQEPLDLRSGLPLDVAAGIEAHDTKYFGRLAPKSALKNRPELFSHPANRVLYPPGHLPRRMENEIQRHGVDSPCLRSHLMDDEIARALLKGDACKAIELRIQRLTQEVRRWGDIRTAWSHSDRPSMDFLLKDLGLFDTSDSEDDLAPA